MDQVELLAKLRKIDEVLLLELLEINSTDIVDAFYDRIKEKSERIRQEIEEEYE